MLIVRSDTELARWENRSIYLIQNDLLECISVSNDS